MSTTRVYFITDVHGSNRCFKKFLNAAKFYNANVLILGGDITGKLLVPIVQKTDGTYESEYQGRKVSLRSKEEVDEHIRNTEDTGFYPVIIDEKEFEELHARPQKVGELFDQQMVERVRKWIALAEERLAKTNVKCFISPGNDDLFAIDPVLSSSPFVINPEERVVRIDGDHEMITLGYTNHTPWRSPREVDEEVLAQKIQLMTGQVQNMKSAIFNIHVPPINTHIDQAPMVDETLKVVTKTGQIQIISAGSSACRTAIEVNQPLLGLHGHIHESRGIVYLGRTMCANPGSEYGEGVLRGFVADLEGDKVKRHLLTSG